MILTIDKVTKTSRPNKPHVQITLKQYPLDTKLDVVGAVKAYLERTEELRTWVRQKSHLLLSFTRTQTSFPMFHWSMVKNHNGISWSRHFSIQSTLHSISFNFQS